MKVIEAYQSADGQIFTDEDKALSRDVDLIGEELDGLIFHVLKLDLSKHQTFNGISGAIRERKALHAVIKKLDYYLSHCED